MKAESNNGNYWRPVVKKGEFGNHQQLLA